MSQKKKEKFFTKNAVSNETHGFPGSGREWVGGADKWTLERYVVCVDVWQKIVLRAFYTRNVFALFQRPFVCFKSYRRNSLVAFDVLTVGYACTTSRELLLVWMTDLPRGIHRSIQTLDNIPAMPDIHPLSKSHDQCIHQTTVSYQERCDH